jgi:hypothetical protein
MTVYCPGCAFPERFSEPLNFKEQPNDLQTVSTGLKGGEDYFQKSSITL